MKIVVSDLKPIMTSYVDEVIMPKSSAMQKFAITLGLLQFNTKIDDMVAKASVFADVNGFIDLDVLKSNCVIALDKAGGSITIPIIGWNFDKDDLDFIFNIATRYGK